LVRPAPLHPHGRLLSLIGVSNLHIENLVRASDVVAVVEVADIKPTGSAPPILFHDHLLQQEGYSAFLSVRRLIKGTRPEHMTLEYAVPKTFIGYRRLQPGTRIVFLKADQNHYHFADPYYPDFPAVGSISDSRDTGMPGDYATKVVREMVAVIASATASPAEKSQILEVDYALPSNGEVVTALREGINNAQGASLRERLQGKLIELGDLAEMPKVAQLLLTNEADPDERTWLLYVIANHVSDRHAIPAIDPLLRSGENSLREAAVEALWHISDREALPQLFKSLNDPDERVRFYAVRALSDIVNEPGWGGPSEAEFQEHQKKYIEHWQSRAEFRREQ
jgi:hypothetical protein